MRIGYFFINLTAQEMLVTLIEYLLKTVRELMDFDEFAGDH